MHANKWYNNLLSRVKHPFSDVSFGILCHFFLTLSRISWAVEQTYSLGLLNFSSPSIPAACVCFFELLGVCSLKLRVDIKALNLILKLWSQNCEGSSMASLKQSLGKAKKTYSSYRNILV